MFNYYYTSVSNLRVNQSQNWCKYCTVALGMHTKCKQCTTTKYFLLPRPCMVTDMHPKAGEGRQGNLEAGEGNLAEGSLAEAGEGRQTSHSEVMEAA